ncbi:ubiquinol-cytochrome C chaperone family protein [Nisaea nitritireducens]|uniref:ubiquinol-cytochrome C chaperone family protein n=1 Tax=Nisaea nitritireducens TaxID=568392 RepID=UPI0029C06427|nr:ubiquinol-cytochrome C chaperone family protein [Nisaea nitritireducens]
MFSKFFKRDEVSDAATEAYQAIIQQARQPDFYTRYGVPDTLDGRFDLLVLHAALVLLRLQRDRAESERFSQALFDTLFVDLDQSLREIGVSDMSVGKKVKQMGKAFYGRLDAYRLGLAAAESDDGQQLAEALHRNLYRGLPEAERESITMAGYVQRQAAHLDMLSSTEIISGKITFDAA